MAHLFLCPFLTFPTHSIIPPPFPGSHKGLGFFIFFDSDLLQHLVNQANLYARLNPFGQVNYQWNDLTVDINFFGVFITTGLVFAKFQQ